MPGALKTGFSTIAAPGRGVLIVFAEEEPIGAGIHEHGTRVVHQQADPVRAVTHQQVGNGGVLRISLAVLESIGAGRPVALEPER